MLLDKVLIFIFNSFAYRHYKKKYNLHESFRFNGYLIRFHGEGNITVGANSYISFFSYINVTGGTHVKIGQDVSIAHNVKIYTSGIDTEEMIINGIKRSIKGNVTIGTNVLIGSNTFICPGVTIGDNVVIGANSVITKNIPSSVVAAGSPASVIKGFSGDIDPKID